MCPQLGQRQLPPGPAPARVPPLRPRPPCPAPRPPPPLPPPPRPVVIGFHLLVALGVPRWHVRNTCDFQRIPRNNLFAKLCLIGKVDPDLSLSMSAGPSPRAGRLVTALLPPAAGLALGPAGAPPHHVGDREQAFCQCGPAVRAVWGGFGRADQDFHLFPTAATMVFVNGHALSSLWCW